MLTALFYLYNFAFTAVFVFYTKYQFQDEKAGWAHAKSLWHRYGMMMRLMLMGACVLYLYVPFDWEDMLLAGAVDMPLWDILINRIALNQRWDYEGTTAKTDRILTGAKWIAYGLFLIAAVIIKFTY